MNNSNGTFRPCLHYEAGSIINSIAAGDFNNDGNNDLAAVDFALNLVAVFQNNGSGSFLPHVDFGTGGHPFSVVAADFNNDVYDDLALANVQFDRGEWKPRKR